LPFLVTFVSVPLILLGMLLHLLPLAWKVPSGLQPISPLRAVLATDALARWLAECRSTLAIHDITALAYHYWLAFVPGKPFLPFVWQAVCC
jgi:hypothetical protein